jgi:hypothetical protein
MDKAKLEELQLLLTAAKVLAKPPTTYTIDYHNALVALLASSLEMVESALTEDVHERGVDLARTKLEEWTIQRAISPYHVKLTVILLRKLAEDAQKDDDDFELSRYFNADERVAIAREYHDNAPEFDATDPNFSRYVNTSALAEMMAALLAPED